MGVDVMERNLDTMKEIALNLYHRPQATSFRLQAFDTLNLLVACGLQPVAKKDTQKNVNTTIC